jgi:hypothetical protein
LGDILAIQQDVAGSFLSIGSSGRRTSTPTIEGGAGELTSHGSRIVEKPENEANLKNGAMAASFVGRRCGYYFG